MKFLDCQLIKAGILAVDDRITPPAITTTSFLTQDAPDEYICTGHRAALIVVSVYSLVVVF